MYLRIRTTRVNSLAPAEDMPTPPDQFGGADRGESAISDMACPKPKAVETGQSNADDTKLRAPSERAINGVDLRTHAPTIRRPLSPFRARRMRRASLVGVAIAWLLCLTGNASAQQIQPEDEVFPLNKPEQLSIRSRDPHQLRNLPPVLQAPPPTVSVPHPAATELKLTLDDSIRLALQDSEVIRVLAGNTARSSGLTIYDPAIAHTAIDRAIAGFDPTFVANNTFGRTSTTFPDNVNQRLDGVSTNTHNFGTSLTQRNLTGGEGSVSFNNNWSRSGPRDTLNPQNRNSLGISYTQPLLQGAGRDANRVPILLARIDTERSYFRFKDTYQELVRSVIEGYWNLVAARTDLWTREQQVKQSAFAFQQADQRLKNGLGDAGEVAQRRVALTNFRASLITARANLLDSEAALKNVMGMPPNDGVRLIPVTPPTRSEIGFDWSQITSTALVSRPDLIELKLILDADEQQIVQSKNSARARLDAVGTYTWNGISGEFASGLHVRSPLRSSGDWTLGMNFSVPLRLRASRANLRSAELLLAKDRASLKQGQHAAIHDLAQTIRGLASSYAQYKAFVETRKAAFVFLEREQKRNQTGLANFLVVLQAITDWGNAVSSEARALTQYNAQLALLERQTGTILETHGIRFCEERFMSLGELGLVGEDGGYPQSLVPQGNTMKYGGGDEPSEKSFDLKDFPERGQRSSKPDEMLEIPGAPAPDGSPESPEPGAYEPDEASPTTPPTPRKAANLERLNLVNPVSITNPVVLRRVRYRRSR